MYFTTFCLQFFKLYRDCFFDYLCSGRYIRIIHNFFLTKFTALPQPVRFYLVCRTKNQTGTRFLLGGRNRSSGENNLLFARGLCVGLTRDRASDEFALPPSTLLLAEFTHSSKWKVHGSRTGPVLVGLSTLTLRPGESAIRRNGIA